VVYHQLTRMDSESLTALKQQADRTLDRLCTL